MASLRDLGLSEYESRAFRSLLETGPTTAKELSRSSDVPMGRIYDVLNTLETHDLIRTQTASRPKKYVAVEPEAALDRLVSAKKRELEETADQYESVAAELADQLEAGDAGEEPFWTARLGDEESLSLLADRLAVASERIDVVTALPEGSIDEELSHVIIDSLESAVERGVDIRVLIGRDLAESLPESILQPYRERLESQTSFQTRISEEARSTCGLIDGKEVCIGVPHPMAEGNTFAMIDLSDREFAAGVAEAFEKRWADAEPLD